MSDATSRVFVLDALRTPIGRLRGGLASVRADDLAAHCIKALLARNPTVADAVGEVVFGATNQAGEDNRNVARMALLLAGLPYEVHRRHRQPPLRLGPRGRAVRRPRHRPGEHDVVLAGGVESMTRAPFVMAKPDEAFTRAAPALYDTSLGWRFPNPRMAERFPLDSMGETAENVAVEHAISREAQDAFALASAPARGPRLGHPRLRGRGRARRGAPAEGPRRGGGPRRVGARRHHPRRPRQSSRPCFGRVARSPRATARPSTTAPPRCCS
jgi:acetyl-CoA acyltransferase